MLQLLIQILNKELKKALDIYKDDLKEFKKYEGESLKERLWEAFQIENKINIKNYGIE